jgi:Uma2 family endonuclease
MAVGTQKSNPKVVEDDVPTLPIYRLNVDQYHRMVRADILTEDDRVELLEGWLVPKMTKHQPHNITTGRMADALTRVLSSGFYVGREEPFTASDRSEPEPDLMIVRGDRDDYPEDPPRAADLVLVIEVAEASLSRDQRDKKRIYAAARIPVYWLANIPVRRFEVYTDPTGPRKMPDYRSRADIGLEQELVLRVADREIIRLTVKDLFPKKA